MNKRLRRQWLELQEFTEMASDRGKKGAAGRWPNPQKPEKAEEDDETPDEDQTDEPQAEEEVDIDEAAV